jgi:hypothetical protein
MMQTTNTNFLPKMKNNKIDSSFLKQSEIMRMKPEAFRRVSIHTDLEFGGGTNGVGQGLQILSPTNISNTIMED